MDAEALAAGRRSAALLTITLLCFGVACATPVGVSRVDPRVVHRTLTSNVLSTGDLSNPTLNVLYRRDLSAAFESQPEVVLAELHAAVAAGRGGRDDVFALAELSFRHAARTRQRHYFLASMVYAYAFLFPGTGRTPADPFDPRFRLACDLYNRGITEGFASDDGKLVDLRAGRYALPFGALDVSFDEAELRWGSRRLVRLVPVADLEVRGMWARYRWPGIGAPLAASTEPLDPERGFEDFVQPWVKVPITAVLRIQEPRQALVAGEVRATLEVDDATSPTSVEIDGRKVPLEIESTAALAYTLAESPVWQQEIKGFLQGAGVLDEKTQLAALSPYERGRIPVVLVHGTASSAGRWAQMLNELGNDPRIREHYQFWLFSYDTGNPILYSAMLLRRSLQSALDRMQRDGPDPALDRMVVIGHSQGGLLAKLTAIESGDRFWQIITRLPFDKLVMPDHTRELIQGMSFIEPVPSVRRVVFIATPQHGSYVANNVIAHWLTRFVTLPIDVVRAASDVVTLNRDAISLTAIGQPPTSVDNMRPGNRFIETLAAIPVSPGVASHSIIAVLGDGPFEEGDDGVVEYQSAHLDDTESELIVRDAHSCQSNPHTIEEVRRILLEHLKPE
ncbi:MAG: esterase/lipase family protein [Candidatus Limnocylindria bacterium]